VNQLGAKLRDFEVMKLERQGVRSRAKWKLFGDHLSMDFFKAVLEAPAMAPITELKDNQGSIYHEREDLERICVNFYTKLYSRENPSLQMLADREAVLNFIPNRFTPTIVQQLDQSLMKQELHDALFQMANAKKTLARMGLLQSSSKDFGIC